jgi:hypothetical protein
VSDTELAAGVDTAVLAPEPLTVKEVRAGELGPQ